MLRQVQTLYLGCEYIQSVYEYPSDDATPERYLQQFYDFIVGEYLSEFDNEYPIDIFDIEKTTLDTLSDLVPPSSGDLGKKFTVLTERLQELMHLMQTVSDKRDYLEVIKLLNKLLF